MNSPLVFAIEPVTANFVDPKGCEVEKLIEIRTNPITLRTSRVTLSRIGEKEAGTETLPEPPPDAQNTVNCPFCSPQVNERTPQCRKQLTPDGRFKRGTSILFPNLFPYGAYSAVSLFDNNHFVEIGTASLESYYNSFLNCADYLNTILNVDSEAKFMTITQNHLPSAGGSLVHPHLQINADRVAANHHRFLAKRCRKYNNAHNSLLFSDYLKHEKTDGHRYIGNTGEWHWMTAFAPEGFFEIWGIWPGCTTIRDFQEKDWYDLAAGVINTQKFYRSLCRNGYNFGLLLIEDGNDYFEMRACIMARSNYAPWVRNDFTGFEVMLGDMATFVPPEETAYLARPFWQADA